MSCHGNTDESCCTFGGGVYCRYLRADVAGRRWACGLMLELGDWQKVVANPRYQQHVAPKFEPLNKIYGVDLNCGNWPPEGVRCDCGD